MRERERARAWRNVLRVRAWSYAGAARRATLVFTGGTAMFAGATVMFTRATVMSVAATVMFVAADSNPAFLGARWLCTRENAVFVRKPSFLLENHKFSRLRPATSLVL